MAFIADKLRKALGEIVIAKSQMEGIFSGVCKDTPERRLEISRMLETAAAILQEESKLVESLQTPTIREWHNTGGVKFVGSVPFKYPPVEEHFVTTLAKEPVVTKEAADALAAMAPK